MPDQSPDTEASAPDANAPDRGIVPVAVDAPAGAAAQAAPKPAELSPAACAARLAALFPALFAPQAAPKPLKLRIQADIQARAPGQFSKKTLSIFLSRYTTGNAYIRALLQAPHRFDLDGLPAGEISAEHRAAATDELARRRALHEQRRAAERAAWREQEKAARQAHQAEQKARQADDQVRRDRAALLRAFETSTLTKANFCALKGVAEADLDAQLAQARQERDGRAPDPQGPPQAARPHQDPRTQRAERPRRPGGSPRPAR